MLTIQGQVFLTVPEVAHLLGTSRQAVYEKMHAQTLLPAHWPRRRWDRVLFVLEEIRRYQAHQAQGCRGHAPGCPDDLTLAEAAQQCGRSYAQLYWQMTKGRLPSHQHGNRRYVRPQDLHQMCSIEGIPFATPPQHQEGAGSHATPSRRATP